MKKKIVTLMIMVGLVLFISTMVTFAISLSSAAVAGAADAAVVKDSNGSNVRNTSSAEISYDTQNMTHRSAKEEWQPHRGQTTMSQEWWYITALLHDSSGSKYMLFSTLFKYDGKDIPVVQSAPQMAAMLAPNTTIISPTVELSNYNTGFHYYDSDGAIVHPKQIWNSNTNTLIYSTPNYTGSWSFDGDNMT
jgi:hypothetical protein